MIIEIKGITKAQKLAIETMLDNWSYLGRIGSSKYVCFMADGDGNFRPKIKVDGKEPKSYKLRSGNDIDVLKDNKILIDYDLIAWDLRKRKGLEE